MKIGVLTYYGDLNFGTNLQAYSTLQVVRKVFPNDAVEIVPFHSFRNDIKPYLYCATPISLYRDWVRIRKYAQFVKDMLGVKKDCILFNPQKGREYIQSRGYDRIYVGADTLLELDKLMKQGKDGLTAYWLGPEITAKQYILAGSSKNAIYENLTIRQKQELQKCVSGYSAIFVRDVSTARLMSSIVDESHVKLICDPTFTLDIDYSCIERYLRLRNLDLTNAVCVHAWKQDEHFIAPFASMLKGAGYKVASMRPAKWADIVLNDLGPMEQAGIFRYFKCHITHRFHDSVFCFKNNTPVVTYLPIADFADSQGDSKYSALFDLFNMREHCLFNDKNSITPQMLFDKMNEACAVWDEESNVRILRELNHQYMSLLVGTK